MKRRLALSVLAASALVAAPTAAMAYDAAGFNTTTTDATPSVGEAFTIRSTGFLVGETCTLTITSNPASISNDAITIAGTKSSTKVATADGCSWTVTLGAAGTYTAAITDGAGALVGDEVLTVAAAAAGGGTGSPTLSDTGFDGAELALGAGALVLAGAGAVFVARRRQTALAR